MRVSRSWHAQPSPCSLQILASSGSDHKDRHKSAALPGCFPTGSQAPCAHLPRIVCAEKSHSQLPACEQTLQDSSSLKGGADEGCAYPFFNGRSHNRNFAFKEVVCLFYKKKCFRFGGKRDNFLKVRNRPILVAAATDEEFGFLALCEK